MKQRFLGILAIFILLSSLGTASWVEGAFNPENTAQKSDAVIYGEVSETTDFGARISITKVFKGNPSNPVTVRLRNGPGKDVSTSASFSTGREVIVMLQSVNHTYQVTTGKPGKYLVKNGTVEIREPEKKRITVEKFQEIIQKTENSNSRPKSSGNDTKTTEPVEDKKFIDRLLGFIISLISF